MKSPDADRRYVFAAAEHMTTHANELLGDGQRHRELSEWG